MKEDYLLRTPRRMLILRGAALKAHRARKRRERAAFRVYLSQAATSAAASATSSQGHFLCNKKSKNRAVWRAGRGCQG
jgi:hypothetical protein